MVDIVLNIAVAIINQTHKSKFFCILFSALVSSNKGTQIQSTIHQISLRLNVS